MKTMKELLEQCLVKNVSTTKVISKNLKSEISNLGNFKKKESNEDK